MKVEANDKQRKTRPEILKETAGRFKSASKLNKKDWLFEQQIGAPTTFYKQSEKTV